MMKKMQVQSVLAYVVVGFFMAITGLMAVYPLLAPLLNTQIPLVEYSQYFAQTASVYTGIVGVVVGYYFGRKEDEDDRRTEVPRQERGRDWPDRDALSPPRSPVPQLPNDPDAAEPPRGIEPPS